MPRVAGPEGSRPSGRRPGLPPSRNAAAYSLLTIGAYTAICHVLINGKLYPLMHTAWFGPYMTVHVIFLFAIASAVLKMAMQLYYYRRGVA